VRSQAEWDEVHRRIAAGMNDCVISRATGIPRPTVMGWRHKGPTRPRRSTFCPRCDGAALDHLAYAYLLGLYLGDGCLSWHRRDVYCLRISLDKKYPNIIAECARAMAIVGRHAVARSPGKGCIVVNASWKHWPCVFPQHGPGRKHDRTIELLPWQRDITRRHPGLLLRGLIHSDGCRILNRVNGTGYPRYHFSNKSSGIRDIFSEACGDYGIRWTACRTELLSVARRRDVARLDLAVGPKT
jgi:hypothetical protein